MTVAVLSCDRCGAVLPRRPGDGPPKGWHIGFPFGDMDVCPRCLLQLEEAEIEAAAAKPWWTRLLNVMAPKNCRERADG